MYALPAMPMPLPRCFGRSWNRAAPAARSSASPRPIEVRLVVDRGDGAVAPHSGPDPHLHRMAAAVGVEDLLAVERDLDRTAGLHRQPARRELVSEGIGLAAERAAVRRRDDADVRARQSEDLL